MIHKLNVKYIHIRNNTFEYLSTEGSSGVKPRAGDSLFW